MRFHFSHFLTRQTYRLRNSKCLLSTSLFPNTSNQAKPYFSFFQTTGPLYVRLDEGHTNAEKSEKKRTDQSFQKKKKTKEQCTGGEGVRW